MPDMVAGASRENHCQTEGEIRQKHFHIVLIVTASICKLYLVLYSLYASSTYEINTHEEKL